MYFQKFPRTLYTLDNRSTVQVVTNISLRVKLTDELVDNFSAYDEYDIKDGDTPETLAFELYGDTNLHWIILHTNEILDPRFDWVLSVNNLYEFAQGKYDRINGVHNYEDSNGNEINGNLSLTVNTTSGFSVGSPITSNVDNSIGFITSIPSGTSIVVTTTKGGFTSGEQIILASNSSVTANITSVTVITGTPVTNLKFEEEQNETRRRIKIIKPQFIERIIKDFESKLSQVDG